MHLFLSLLALVTALSGQEPTPTYCGQRLIVKPVFFVPSDAPLPTTIQTEHLIRHLKIAQARYYELLQGEDTFLLDKKATVCRSRITIAELKAKPNGAAEFVVNELMAHDHVNRWNCRFVYVTLYVGTGNYPGGGGRPINGGHSNGGGILILSATQMDAEPNFQSTLQHELGHGFGLPHVDVYGYSMINNNSLMSYNPKHHTNYFHPAANSGQLIPEDMRGLAQNKWAFPAYIFDPTVDVPVGYQLKGDVTLGPMDLSIK